MDVAGRGPELHVCAWQMTPFRTQFPRSAAHTMQCRAGTRGASAKPRVKYTLFDPLDAALSDFDRLDKCVALSLSGLDASPLGFCTALTSCHMSAVLAKLPRRPHSTSSMSLPRPGWQRASTACACKLPTSAAWLRPATLTPAAMSAVGSVSRVAALACVALCLLLAAPGAEAGAIKRMFMMMFEVWPNARRARCSARQTNNATQNKGYLETLSNPYWAKIAQRGKLVGNKGRTRAGTNGAPHTRSSPTSTPSPTHRRQRPFARSRSRSLSLTHHRTQPNYVAQIGGALLGW
jgi:hypothetical protein